MINCFALLRKILDFTSKDIRDPIFFSDSIRRDSPLYEVDNWFPSRRTGVNFVAYSTAAIVGKELICGTDIRFEIWGTKGYNLQVRRTIARRKGDSLGNKYLGLFYEPDAPVLVVGHWLVPFVVAITGILLLSFWRIHQKRRRRRTDQSGRLANIV